MCAILYQQDFEEQTQQNLQTGINFLSLQMEQEVNKKKLFVGNISYGVTDELLAEHFAQVGQVESAKIIIDKMTGRSKGFGFVEMSAEDEAQKAIAELDQKELDGRALNVNEAQPPKRQYENRGNF